MLFSIITPCFNSEKTIRRTLESVLNQTFQDFEYIIIDSESTDRTLEIIESYKPSFGNKLKVISEHDNGIYEAINKGIKIANGQLVGIINSDDFYENNCLEKIANAYKEDNPFQIIYGMMRVVDEKGEELAISFNHHRNMNTEMINHPTCFITKRLYDEFGVYDTKYKSAADLDFMLRMNKESAISSVPVYDVLTNFTRGGISGSYTGIQEDNKVRYVNGLVGRKKYILTKSKNALKHFMGV